LARVLHPAGYGAYAVALAFGSVVGALAGAGVQPLTIREIARAPRASAGMFWTAFLVRSAFNLAGIALAAGVLAFAGFERDTRVAAFLFTISVLFDGMTAQAMTLFRGRQTMGIEAKLTSAGRIANLIFTLVAISIAPSVAHVALASALASAGLFAFALRLVVREIPVRPLRLRAARALLAESIPFAAGGLLVYIFFRIDVLLLRFLGVAEAHIGNYSAAYRVMEVTRVPSAMLAQGYGPAAARFRNVSDKGALLALASRAWTVTIGIALPCALVFALVPHLVIHIIFSNAYREAIGLLFAMAAMPVFMAINGVAIQTVNSQGYQGWSTGIFGLCAAFNVGLNLILIPRIGAMGAAIATIATEVLQTVALMAWIVVRFGIPKPALASALVGFGGALGAAAFVPQSLSIARAGLALAVYAAVAGPGLRANAGRSFA
jgi:O-antigen/teichoic acid export membrane protein